MEKIELFDPQTQAHVRVVVNNSIGRESHLNQFIEMLQAHCYHHHILALALTPKILGARSNSRDQTIKKSQLFA